MPTFGRYSPWQRTLESNQIPCGTNTLAGWRYPGQLHSLIVGAEGFEPTTHAGYLIYSQAPNQFVHYSHRVRCVNRTHYNRVAAYHASIAHTEH